MKLRRLERFWARELERVKEDGRIRMKIETKKVRR
jgi:hypothetical protein